MSDDDFIERRIITGLIVSTEYLQRTQEFWKAEYFESATACMLAGWCWDYFNQYQKSPGRDIEGIYASKLRAGLKEDKAEWIEGVLSNLSDEYERGQFNVEYLIDETKSYFQMQHLNSFAEDIMGLISEGDCLTAEKIACGYSSIIVDNTTSIDPFSNASRIKRAFADREKPLVKFPKALGEFWNRELVRGGFIAFLGPEKRGKTFWLLEIAIRAMRSGCNVVFFQAGDMTENQQLRRLCIYLAKQSDQERYCNGMYLPVLDCKLNQMDTCEKDERECDFGIFEDLDSWTAVQGSHERLIAAHKENQEYKPCHNCAELRGSVWLDWKEPTGILQWKSAYRKLRAFQNRYKRRFKLSTHISDSLSVLKIKTLLDIWERQEDFVPDVIVIDYADLLQPDSDVSGLDFRNQNNKLWQRLRSLSQMKHCLVVTATQAAASSYEHTTLRLSDFSEDKRKYAHVTAMYGLNQTFEEKKIGIMRINEMVVREADFDTTCTIKVLQRLQMGRPFLGSFF